MLSYSEGMTSVCRGGTGLGMSPVVVYVSTCRTLSAFSTTGPRMCRKPHGFPASCKSMYSCCMASSSGVMYLVGRGSYSVLSGLGEGSSSLAYFSF